MPDDVTDLCMERCPPESDDEDLLVCTLAEGHQDDGWHWDVVAALWWRRTAHGSEVAEDGQRAS